MIAVLVLRMDKFCSKSESTCNYSHGQELFYKFVSKITNKIVNQLFSMTVYIQKCGNWKKRCCLVHLLPHFYEESYGYDTKDVGKAQMVKSFTLGVQNTVVHYHMGWRKNKRLTNL